MADVLTKADGSTVSDEDLETIASSLTDSFEKPKTGTTYALNKAASSNASPSWDDSDSVSVDLEGEPPKNFTKSLSDLQSQSKNLSRMDEKGFVNEQTGAAMAIRKDGQINLSASRYAQYRMNPNGKVVEQTMEKHDVTNRLSITTDEILVNNHKLNPAFYELTDMKLMKLPTTRTGREPTIGNLTVECSVLVKAWDKHLNRYMLVRRPARLPLFSNLLNVPDITPGIHVQDPLKVESASQFMALSTGGYQVNAAITDANSLIGKEGISRYGAESGGGASMGQFQAMQGTSGQVEKAIQWAISIANDDSHLYGQENRDGPNYDCSSFVYHAFEYAGFGVIQRRGYTGNGVTMPEDFQAAGFQMLPFDRNNLQRGDILWWNSEARQAGHTEIYLGDGKKVGAHGQNRPPADNISVNDMYYDYWTHIFRCAAQLTVAAGVANLNLQGVGTGKANTAAIISKKTGIPTEYILAQMIYESGWNDDESGGYYHNYGGLKAGDIGYGLWGSNSKDHTIFPDDETYADYWCRTVIAIQDYRQELIQCAANNDPIGYIHIMKMAGYFEADESEYANGFASIVRRLQGR